MDWKERLTEDKSLSQVYRRARRVASSRWNVSVSWLVFILLTAGLVADQYCGRPLVGKWVLVSSIREVSEIGFVFTSAILGFLIAGFAIFSSITKPEVFILLAKLDHPKYQISQLQFIFFNFLIVFIHFIGFLTLSIFVKLFLFPSGLLTSGVQFVFSFVPAWEEYIIILVFSSLTGWLAFLLTLLKSFIWNLYQAVLVSIGVEAELREEGDSEP